MFNSEHVFKAHVVQLILMKEADEAIKALSQFYNVGVPNLKVGMPKKYSKKLGCYVSKTKTIHVINREKLEDPFVILHEFYHRLRTQDRKHRGTEKHANRFAEEFIEAFQTFPRDSFHVSY
jgi:Zn-dependent peptidase ImmA (M78 family)